jgi:hypothetical protein
VESAFILLVESVAAVESDMAGAVTAAESEGVDTEVESPVASLPVEELLQAVKNAATVKTSNNFFILINFRFKI